MYRSAASVFVLRLKAEGGFDILLLHKPRKRDSWQLPQGGREEGETIEQAALRELGEEAGLHNVELLGKSGRVYQYDFPPSYRRFRPDHVCGQRIEFIVALAPADAEVVVDNKEIDKYVWVGPGEIQKYLRRGAYLELVMGLYDEAKSFLGSRQVG